MKTLTQQLKERQERIRSLGGAVPTQGTVERQLCECDTEIQRLTASSRRTTLVESYQSMGLSEAEAKVAAGVDRAIQSKNVNRAFKAGRMFESALLMGFNEAEAAVFANPKLTEEEIRALRLAEHLTVKDVIRELGEKK